MMLKSQTGSGFADATPLPLIKLTLPTHDDLVYRVESMNAADFSVITSEVLKVRNLFTE